MRVLIAVKGTEDQPFFRRAVALARLTDSEEILLAHVVDVTPYAEMERGRERFLGRRPLSEERSAELRQAEKERARAVLQFAYQALADLGIKEERLREISLRGKPNEELRRVAEQSEVDLIVVRGRPGKPGPHSLGKTARFLVDHAPRAALLVR